MPKITASDGSEHKVDKTLLTTGSVIYDAVFVPGGKESAAALQQDGDAIHFVNEAFKHCKALAATGEGVDLLLASSIVAPGTNGTNPEQRLQKLSGVVAERKPKDLDGVAKRFMQAVAQHRAWDRQSPETGQVPSRLSIPGRGPSPRGDGPPRRLFPGVQEAESPPVKLSEEKKSM